MGSKLWTREEDRLLKELAGKRTALSIAQLLGRPKNGVHHRINKLGLSGHIRGEHHWAAKLSDDMAEMIGALADAGFEPKKIELLVKSSHDVSYSTILGICSARCRQSPSPGFY